MNELWTAIQGIGVLVSLSEIVGGIVIAVVLYLFRKSPFPFSRQKVIQVCIGIMVIFLLALGSVGLLAHVSNPIATDRIISATSTTIPSSSILTPSPILPTPTFTPTTSVTPIVTQTAEITPTANPTTIPTPPPSGTVVYNTDTSGFSGWNGSSSWYTKSNVLYSNPPYCTGCHDMDFAPVILHGITNYSIVARIRIVGGSDGSGFGIVARMSRNGDGYFGELGDVNSSSFHTWSQIEALCPDNTCQSSSLGSIQNYNIDQNWHVYRFEVQDNNIRFYIDNIKIEDGTDNTYPGGDYVGLSTGGTQLTISSFKVTTL